MKQVWFGLLLMTPVLLVGGELPVFLDEIVVEGEAVRETATVNVVTAEEMKKQGARTVAEALELVPGVNVRVGGRGEAYIRLRGFRQREVAVLINGVPVTAPYDGQMDLSSLPVDAVEKIEVVKGASSLLYGSNAMGGVVNIITKRSDGKTGGSVWGQGGTGESLDGGVWMKGSLGETRYLFTGGYQDRDAFPVSEDYSPHPNQGTGDRENSYRRAWNGQVSLGWDVGEESTLSLNLSHMDTEKGIPHHESDDRARYWQFPTWTHSVADVTMQIHLGSASLKAKVYYDDFENVLEGYDDRTYTTQDSKSAFTSSFDDYAYGGDLFFRYRNGDRHLWKSALRIRRDVHNEQDDIGEPWNRFEADIFTLPFEGEWYPAETFALTYGVSFDWMLFDEVEGESSHDTSSVNPQVALLYSPREDTQFRLSAARKSRFPTLKELFSSRSGNPELETMKVNIYEAGLDYTARKDLLLSLVLFYNDVKDLIDRAGKNDPYENVDEARFKGFEAGMTWDVDPHAVIHLSYTRLDAKDVSSEEPRYVQYRPKHKVDLRTTLNLPWEIALALSGSHVSSQTTDDDEVLELDAYTLINLRVTKRFLHHWEIYLHGHNLFDELYYESVGYPMEGRMISGGIGYRF